MELGTYVRERDVENGPIGRIDAIMGNDDINLPTVYTVTWGVADGRIYKDELTEDDLDIVPTPVQPEEIILRQAKEAGARIEFDRDGLRTYRVGDE